VSSSKILEQSPLRLVDRLLAAGQQRAYLVRDPKSGRYGLRHTPYDTFEGFLRDGLRLSLGMTRQNSTAGLWWGGGKGIIASLVSEHWQRSLG
jgi:hypothetical protein